MTVHPFTWFVLCVGDGGVYHERFTMLALQLSPPPLLPGRNWFLRVCLPHIPCAFFSPFHFWDTLLPLAPVSVYTQHLTLFHIWPRGVPAMVLYCGLCLVVVI